MVDRLVFVQGDMGQPETSRQEDAAVIGQILKNVSGSMVITPASGTLIVNGIIVSSGGGGGGSNTFNASCTPAESIGDAVYVSGPGMVAQARANTILTTYVVGIIIAKPSATTCTVQVSDTFGIYSGLTPGVTYFLSDTTPGAITATAPTTTGTLVERVGVAIDSSTIVIMPDPTIVQN